jgi:L-ribulose-5-phosphate 4-epimerase
MPFTPTRETLLPDLDPRVEMVLLARTLWREGYDDHLAGHITYNLGDGTLLCNPWLLTWEEFGPDDVIRIDHDGNVVEGDWPAPLGIPLHLELHKARPGVKVAMHNHPRYGTVWSDLPGVPPRHDQSSVLGGGVTVLVDEYGGGVSDTNLAAAAVAAMGDADIAVLAHHGVFVLGGSVRAVHQRAVAFEQRSRAAWMVKVAGGGPEMHPAVLARFEQSDGEGFIGFWEAMARRELRDDPSLLAGG